MAIFSAFSAIMHGIGTVQVQYSSVWWEVRRHQKWARRPFGL